MLAHCPPRCPKVQINIGSIHTLGGDDLLTHRTRIDVENCLPICLEVAVGLELVYVGAASISNYEQSQTCLDHNSLHVYPHFLRNLSPMDE